MDKGARLNRRVWQLFSNAGFQTKPNFFDGQEQLVNLSPTKTRKVDLHATDPELGISILASNKSGSIQSWTEHVNDWVELKKKGKYDKLLFVITGKHLDETDLDYARGKGAEVWTEEQLSYYEAIVATIKKYAKYEILNNLEITTREETVIQNVLALKINQPNVDSSVELYTFTMNPDSLLKTCAVFRKALSSSGNKKKAYQRMLNKKRLPKIAEFVSRPQSLLPVNIIVNLTDDVEIHSAKLDDLKKSLKLSNDRSEIVRLSIPMKYSSLELIDGQHRLFGFSLCSDPDILKNYNLVVLGIRELKEPGKTNTFVAINDNSRRMDANLVSFLKYTDDEPSCQHDHKLMAIKIVFELNKRTPFHNSIRLVDIGDQKITLKGFSGYDLQGLVGERGLLRSFYPTNNSKKYIDALRLYFSCVKENFETEWSDPNKYITATNRGISAFLKLLKIIMRIEQKQLERPFILKYLKALKSNWGESWETAKLKSSFVGSQGWTRLYLDMVKAIRKDFKNFK